MRLVLGGFITSLIATKGAWQKMTEVKSVDPVPANTGFQSADKVPALPQISLNKYQGRWFEIGVNFVPKFTFEMGCESTSATYTLDQVNIDGQIDTRVKLTNSCDRTGWSSYVLPSSTVKGIAYPIKPIIEKQNEFILSPAKFEVVIPEQRPKPAPGSLGNYWIIYVEDLGTDRYQNTVIISPKGFFTCIWILSRNPKMSDSELARIKGKAIEAGLRPYQLEKPFFYLTNQDKSIQEENTTKDTANTNENTTPNIGTEDTMSVLE